MRQALLCGAGCVAFLFAMPAFTAETLPSKDTSTPLRVEVSLSVQTPGARESTRQFALSLTAPGSASTTVRATPREPSQAPDDTEANNAPGIGSLINVQATPLDEGRFSILLRVDDMSLSGAQAKEDTPGRAVTRSWDCECTLILKPGESQECASATDPVTGGRLTVIGTLKAPK